MMSYTLLCSYCALRNPCSLSAKSHHSTYVSSLTSLGSPWTTSLSLKFFLRQELRRRTIESTRRFSGSRPPGSYDSVAVSSSRQFGLVQSEVERTRKQIFEDGFAIFPGMWSKAEVDEVDDDVLVVAQEQEKVLKSFLMDPVDVFSQPQQWLHAPGHRCTDAATSPEPYWHHSWQLAWRVKLCRDRLGVQLLLYLSQGLKEHVMVNTMKVGHSADQTAKMFCGGVSVFPRSHWIMNDKIANSISDRSSFPQPCDVPAAAPMELRLACGDMVLLHPLLAFTIAPNSSSSSTRLLVFHLGDATSNRLKSRVGEEKHMWSGWHSMENFLMDRTTSVEEEMVQLQIEEGKAQLGGWHATTEGLPSGQESLATSPSTQTAPRDLLAWRLRNSALQFMQDGEWSNGLSMLLRRAGLRPTCYWTALQDVLEMLQLALHNWARCCVHQAGRCCMKSAPAGQLRGRAGRKCTLEDGERFLLRAIEMAPGWPLAYAELMRCLALMGRGREQEISGVMELMKQRCKLERLCLRYPTDSEILQTCWNDCEALSATNTCNCEKLSSE